jgi:glycosyltransferase involved in cell wall biosynthesis
MADRKKIAILVPAYNSTATLEKTLRSILALDDDLDRHIDFLMLSDDGSKDDTIALAQRTWTHRTVPLVTKRAKRNQGEYHNVNSAMAAMPRHIEWVLLMHSDNEAMASWIRVLANECGRVDSSVGTVCGSYERVSAGVVTDAGDQRGPGYVEDVKGNAASVKRTIFDGCWWHNGASALRVSAWKDIGGHPQDTPLLSAAEILGLRKSGPNQRKIRVAGDWDTLLRFLSSGYTIRYVGTPIIRYIEFNASVSSGTFAWHGDQIERLQVTRRHQSVMGVGDILWIHWIVTKVLMRRLAGAVLRGHWRRAWYAIQAVPVLIASLFASIVRNRRGEGTLPKITFGY